MSVVLVTGCSSGFGLAAAIALARRGEQVIATMRDLSKADRLREAAGTLDIDILQLDITDARSREDAIRAATAKYGGIDVLINNAGIFSMGALEMLGESDLRALFETNVFSTFALTTLVLPSMRERRSGRIVNVTSAGAFVARQFMTGYAASKHAMDAISIGMDIELKPFNIRVTSVAPVQYGTDIGENTPPPSADTPYGIAPANQYSEWKSIMMGRVDLSPVTNAIVEAATAPDPKQRYLVAPGPLPIDAIFGEKQRFDEGRRVNA
jgi:NAD(P)-dependent dehydrogenase (short-subunit alcohol dehydrogenase family)